MAGGFPITHMTNSNLPAQTKATFLQFTRKPFPNVLPCLSAICRSINNVCSSCLISFLILQTIQKLICLWKFWRLLTGKDLKKESRNNRDVRQKTKVIDDLHDFIYFDETMKWRYQWATNPELFNSKELYLICKTYVKPVNRGVLNFFSLWYCSPRYKILLLSSKNGFLSIES